MKIKTVLVLLFGLLLVGCKGPKGDKGDRGDPGPGEIKIYQGLVSSNDFTISIPHDPNSIGSIHLFLTDGFDWSESPYFLPAEGVNVFHIYTPTGLSGTMRIINGALAGATGYQVVLILA